MNKNAALLVTSNQYPETPSHWEGYLDNQNLNLKKSLPPQGNEVNNDKLQKVLYLFIKKNILLIKQTECVQKEELKWTSKSQRIQISDLNPRSSEKRGNTGSG